MSNIKLPYTVRRLTKGIRSKQGCMHASSDDLTVIVSDTAERYLLAGAGELGTQWLREQAAGHDLGGSVTADASAVTERMARELDDEESSKSFMDDGVGPHGLDQVYDLEQAVNTGKPTCGGYDE